MMSNLQQHKQRLKAYKRLWGLSCCANFGKISGWSSFTTLPSTNSVKCAQTSPRKTESTSSQPATNAAAAPANKASPAPVTSRTCSSGCNSRYHRRRYPKWFCSESWMLNLGGLVSSSTNPAMSRSRVWRMHGADVWSASVGFLPQSTQPRGPSVRSRLSAKPNPGTRASATASIIKFGKLGVTSFTSSCHSKDRFGRFNMANSSSQFGAARCQGILWAPRGALATETGSNHTVLWPAASKAAFKASEPWRRSVDRRFMIGLQEVI